MGIGCWIGCVPSGPATDKNNRRPARDYLPRFASSASRASAMSTILMKEVMSPGSFGGGTGSASELSAPFAGFFGEGLGIFTIMTSVTLHLLPPPR